MKSDRPTPGSAEDANLNPANDKVLEIVFTIEQFEAGFRGPPPNPFFAWAAIDYAIDLQLPIPAWAYQYLAESAKQMVALAASYAENSAIPKALGFTASRGISSAGSQLQRSRKRELACAAFAIAILDGMKKSEALDAAAATAGAAEGGSVEPRTVEDYLPSFFPDRLKGETWARFFRESVNPESKRYSSEISILVDMYQKYLNYLRANAKRGRLK